MSRFVKNGLRVSGLFGGLVLVSLVCVLYVYSRSPLTASPDIFKDSHALGFKIKNIETFSVEDEFGGYFADDQEYNILGKDEKGALLKIKILSNINETDAMRYSAGQLLLLRSLYDDRLPPYPEFLTNQTGCAKEYVPVSRETKQGSYYVTYAGERFDYGLCADDLIKFRAGFGVFYCKATAKLFQLEYFAPREVTSESIASVMDSFACVVPVK